MEIFNLFDELLGQINFGHYSFNMQSSKSFFQI